MAWIDPYLIPAANGVAYGLLLFTVAAGLTLAFGVANVLNLAHGTLYIAGGYAACVLTDGSWWGLILAAIVGTAVGGAMGAGLSIAVAPLTDRGHLPQALLTFGIATAATTVATELFGTDELRSKTPSGLNGSVSIAGHSYPAYRLVFIVVGAVLALGIWLLVTRTRLGARVRATADDRSMVATMGLSPRGVLIAVLSAAGALAGFAGALGAPILGPGEGIANTVLLQSLIIVVLGGLGSIGGAFLAALAVGQVQSLGVVLAPTWTPYLLFAAMGLALLIRRPAALGLASAR